MSMTNEEASNILRLLAAESLEGVSRFIESEKNRDLYKRAYEMAIKSLEESVSVVRCKDCKHWHEDVANFTSIPRGGCKLVRGLTNGEFFCALGERKG